MASTGWYGGSRLAIQAISWELSEDSAGIVSVGVLHIKYQITITFCIHGSDTAGDFEPFFSPISQGDRKYPAAFGPVSTGFIPTSAGIGFSVAKARSSAGSHRTCLPDHNPAPSELAVIMFMYVRSACPPEVIRYTTNKEPSSRFHQHNVQSVVTAGF